MKVTYDENGKAQIIRSTYSEQPDRDKVNPFKFKHIDYLQKSCMSTFEPHEMVWIEEKIDGTNVAAHTSEHNEYVCYGRNFELGTWYTNKGAYDKLLLLKDKIKEVLGDKYIAYFEYLTKHHVKYSEDKENGLYLIGVREKATRKYLTPDKVYEIAEKLGVERPVTFYYGPFKDWSIAQSFVGQSAFGAKKGEGVIVKAYDEKSGIKMVKIVADDFREVMKHNPEEAVKKMNAELAKRARASEIVTDARIRKQLFAMMDEGLIQSVDNMSKEDKNIAIKYIGKRIYDDCINEELQFVLDFGKDFGKYSFMISKNFINSL